MTNDTIRDVIRHLMSLQVGLRLAPESPLGAFSMWMLLDLDDHYTTYPRHDLSMYGDTEVDVDAEIARLIKAGYAQWDDKDPEDLRLTPVGAAAAQQIYARFQESAAQLAATLKELQESLDRLRDADQADVRG